MDHGCYTVRFWTLNAVDVDELVAGPNSRHFLSLTIGQGLVGPGSADDARFLRKRGP